MMIDIHNHALYGVDDGAKTIEDSIAMINHAIEIGIKELFLTPHYNRRYNKVNVKKEFEELVKIYKDSPIKLYLGREYRYNSLEPFKQFTMGNSNYILLEFSTTIPDPIEEVCYNVSRNGFIPIIAHIERYHYLTKEDYEELKDVALFQINSEAVIGKSSFKKDRKIVKYLLKQGLVDFVASDAHNTTDRKNTLDKAYNYIQKKYGKELALDLFVNNPKKIIETHLI